MAKKRRIGRKIGLGLLLVLVGIQFVRIDKTNPPVVEGEDFIVVTQPPAEVATLLRNACYDCHSNETKYPWYTNVAPISWWIEEHIRHGRGELNFSKWGTYPIKKAHHKLKESYEMVEGKEMPLPSYLWTHSEAELTNEEQQLLVQWFKRTGGFDTQ